MRCVNCHLVKRVFKFEGLSDIADMANKGDYSLSYDLTSGYYHVALQPDLGALLDSSGKGNTANTTTYPLGCSHPHGLSLKSFVSWLWIGGQEESISPLVWTTSYSS